MGVVTMKVGGARFREFAAATQSVQCTMSALAVGLMSGTSMDGIDACVLEITEPTEEENAPKLKLVAFVTYPYSCDLQADLTVLSRSGSVTDVCRYNVLFGRMFGDAATDIVTGCGLNMEQISVIGSHGQTIHHLPYPTPLHGYSISSTLQIGEPSVIAHQCGVTTVGDFRMADMAVGGQGAPLVPYLDEILLQKHFEDAKRLGLLLNIGGISNISVLTGSDECHKLLGFDCGPGNVLIDLLMRRWFNREYDKDGEIGLRGTISDELLTLLMKDDFVQRPPPKSTGREYYGERYLDECLSTADKLRIGRDDIVATVSEYTAATVWRNYELHIKPLLKQEAEGYDLFVSGGGASNTAIMRGLQRLFKGFNVSTTQDIGIDRNAKEAICFALLGYQTLKGRPTNIPSVTGAKKRVLLGKMCTVIR